jgi:hypothetical protein
VEGFGFLSSASPPLFHRYSNGQGFPLAWYYCTTPVKTPYIGKTNIKNQKSKKNPNARFALDIRLRRGDKFCILTGHLDF